MKTISLNTALDRGTRVATQRVQRRSSHRWLHELLNRGLALLREWRRRVRSRAELARLDERMLRDIGVTRAEIWFETSKPFWRQ
jgi:uncharacterized protein YjiS (DUF1127 family)